MFKDPSMPAKMSLHEIAINLLFQLNISLSLKHNKTTKTTDEILPLTCQKMFAVEEKKQDNISMSTNVIL